MKTTFYFISILASTWKWMNKAVGSHICPSHPRYSWKKDNQVFAHQEGMSLSMVLITWFTIFVFLSWLPFSITSFPGEIKAKEDAFTTVMICAYGSQVNQYLACPSMFLTEDKLMLPLIRRAHSTLIIATFIFWVSSEHSLCARHFAKL